MSFARYVVLFALTAVFAPSGNAEPFRQGEWTLHSYGSFTHGLRNKYELAESVTVGGAYFVADSFALGAQATGMYMDQPVGEDGPGGALSLLARYHFVNLDRFSSYLEASSGPAYFDNPTPVDGSRFNFLCRLGGGMTFSLDEHVDLMAGAHFSHISNAHIHGEDEGDIGINALDVFVGLMWRF
jgi:hypothetical protein